MTVTEGIHQHVLKVPAAAWTPAVETGGEIREGAWGAELTGGLLDGRPKSMRLIVGKGRPRTPRARDARRPLTFLGLA